MTILTAPERLAKMLIDADSRIVAAYAWTQKSVDMIERPAWLIFVGDASFPQDTSEQEQVQQNYQLEYVGENFDTGYAEEYEKLARQAAYNTVQYLLGHNQMQMSNQRGVFPEPLEPLDYIISVKLNTRSAITLMSRDAVDQAYWGFTIDITVTEMLDYDYVIVST